MTVEPTEQWSAEPGMSGLSDDGRRALGGAAAVDPTRAQPSVQEIIDQQKAVRRRNFWLGFIGIAVVGSLWAYLFQAPVEADFFAEEADFEVEAEPVVVEFDRPPPPIPTTAAMPVTPGEGESTTTGPETTLATTVTTAPIGEEGQG